MKFPQEIVRFLFWVFFKPFSLRRWIDALDPAMGNTSALLASSPDRSAQPFKYLAVFYVLVLPWLLALGTGLLLTWLGMDVNWLKLVFTMSIVLALSLTFSIDFSIALLLPFSVAVAIWSSTSFSNAVGILFSFTLGTAYGLSGNSARWGLTAGLVYGVLFSILIGPLNGLSIGAAFLLGYFRIIFYLVEAPLSWILGNIATRGDALKLWQFSPVQWDELIWFPLPGLDKHLLAIRKQNGPATQAVIHQVRDSFRQRWAAERISEKE